MSNDVYFETLAEAITRVEAKLVENGATLAADENISSAFNGGVNYEQTVTRAFMLDTYKGKGTRKGLTVSIHRMPSGKYELVSYLA